VKISTSAFVHEARLLKSGHTLTTYPYYGRRGAEAKSSATGESGGVLIHASAAQVERYADLVTRESGSKAPALLRNASKINE
jgi:hypothetical protein